MLDVGLQAMPAQSQEENSIILCGLIDD